MEKLLLYIIILLLVVINISIYFSMKRKIEKVEKEKENTTKHEEKEKESHKEQNKILANMSEDVYILTKKATSSKKDNDTIISSAYNIVELLRIQANNIDVFNEKFNFNSLLDELVVGLKSTFSKSDIDTVLTFDIESSVPRYFVGDSLHCSRVLSNILEYAILKNSKGIINMKASTNTSYTGTLMLDIEISERSDTLSQEEIFSLFTFGEGEDDLRLYVAKKLVEVLKGELTLSSTAGQGNLFSIRLPMHDKGNNFYRKYSLPDKAMTEKNTLIVSSRAHLFNSLKSLFGYFKHNVSVVNVLSMPKYNEISQYDIVIFDFASINSNILDILTINKTRKTFYSVLSNDIFKAKQTNINHNLFDTELIAPSNLENIFNLIVQESTLSSPKAINTDTNKKEILAPTTPTSSMKINDNITEKDTQDHREKPIQTTAKKEMETTELDINIDSFKKFIGANILMVEDNLINQKIVINVLKKSGMNISIANNGEEALRYIFQDKKTFHIILMDISMPVMDGYTATKTIREDKANDMMKIVTFTAFTSGNEIDKMFALGANASLTKPLNIKSLYSIIDTFIDNDEREITVENFAKREGLDIELGIQNADESEALYKETLKEFMLLYKNFDTDILGYIHTKKYAMIQQKSIEIITILNAIGAYALNDSISEIRKKIIYNSTEQLPTLTDKFSKTHKDLIKTIETYLS